MHTDESREAELKRMEIRGMCGQFGIGQPSITCDWFSEFVRRQGWTPEKKMDRIEEWGRRFQIGEQFHHADGNTRQMLLDIMLEGPGGGTAPHLDHRDVERFCERHSRHVCN